jgi:DNA repair ATPase RecN
MLERVQIRGVGANERLDIEFGPNVTSIIGKNFQGKSWALRALRLVMLNKPAGDSYINWDCDEAKVRLSLDGKIVTRIRNNSDNSYRLSGKPKPYTAFGNDVPLDIAKLMNVSDRLNFQTQHSTKENRIPFWFCETAGEVSRQLNSIVNLELIDVTLANIQSQQRAMNSVSKAAEQDLSIAIEEQKELSYVEDMNKELEHCESLQEAYQDIVEKRSKLEETLKSVEKHTSIRDRRSRYVTEAQHVLSAHAEYTKAAEKAADLAESIEKIRGLRQALENKPPSIKPLERLKIKADEFSAHCEELGSLIESIERGRRLQCQKKEELKRSQRELDKEKILCPNCGTEIVL